MEKGTVKWQAQDVNPALLDSKIYVLSTKTHCLSGEVLSLKSLPAKVITRFVVGNIQLVKPFLNQLQYLQNSITRYSSV